MRGRRRPRPSNSRSSASRPDGDARSAEGTESHHKRDGDRIGLSAISDDWEKQILIRRHVLTSLLPLAVAFLAASCSRQSTERASSPAAPPAASAPPGSGAPRKVGL